MNCVPYEHCILEKLVSVQEELLYAIHGLVEKKEIECARRALRVLAATGDYRVAIESIADWEMTQEGG